MLLIESNTYEVRAEEHSTEAETYGQQLNDFPYDGCAGLGEANFWPFVLYALTAIRSVVEAGCALAPVLA